MSRILAWLFVLFCLDLLAAPSHCSAQYYGVDTARTLTERLQSVRNFPVGHPRLYDLQGYEGYRPYSMTQFDSPSNRQARRQQQMSPAATRIAQKRTSELKRQQGPKSDHNTSIRGGMLEAVWNGPPSQPSRSDPSNAAHASKPLRSLMRP